MKKILVSLMLLVMTALSAHAQFEKDESLDDFLNRIEDECNV